MKRFLAALLALLVAVLVVRTLLATSRQLPGESASLPEVDERAVARHLAAGLRFATVSHEDPADDDADAFRALHELLRTTYPAAHTALRRETVAELSLLYEWPGRDASLPPVLLLAHLDVVPVEPGTEGQWTQPPFAGVVADGFVWGRGTMDDKLAVFCILEAVESLVTAGFQPDRTVLIAFGHDEEVGGDRGAAAIAALLARRGVAPLWALDEGGIVARNALPGVEADVAVVGIAEKGSVSIELTVAVEGGHSSMPPPSTAIGILSRAITALEENQRPASIGGATGLFLDHVGPELPFPAALVLANRWLFGPLIRLGFSTDPRMDAMLRTTTAVTVVRGGVKENVLPSQASAVVNFRILPGETYQDVARHVRETIDDERVALRVGAGSRPRDPTPISPVDGPAFEGIARTIGQVFPDALVVPYLVVGGTDARHYAVLTSNLYRFGPFVYDLDDSRRIHATDERISLSNLANGVRFYRQLIANSQSGGT